jgi:hypothetical protein
MVVDLAILGTFTSIVYKSSDWTSDLPRWPSLGANLEMVTLEHVQEETQGILEAYHDG